MEKPRFKKNQIVYYASTNVARNVEKNNEESNLCMVIERQIESCGTKKATFFDRAGNDFCFGKSIYFHNSHYEIKYFSTPEEAFLYLESYKDTYKNNNCFIESEVFSDANDEWCKACKKWKEKIKIN